MPLSTDCEMAAESFFGQEGYTRNQAEKMLNASWINAYIITMGLWTMRSAFRQAVEGLLPESNKLVCLVTCVCLHQHDQPGLRQHHGCDDPDPGSDPDVHVRHHGALVRLLRHRVFVHKDLLSSGAKMYGRRGASCAACEPRRPAKKVV